MVEQIEAIRTLAAQGVTEAQQANAVVVDKLNQLTNEFNSLQSQLDTAQAALVAMDYKQKKERTLNFLNAIGDFYLTVPVNADLILNIPVNRVDIENTTQLLNAQAAFRNSGFMLRLNLLDVTI